MNEAVAFIGDVHGNLAALRSLIERLKAERITEIVLLGDYINKGSDAAGVLDLLIRGVPGVTLFPLRGNHEEVFLQSMRSGDVRPILRMSGAPTIWSYVRGPVGHDVYADLRAAVPDTHLDFLAALPLAYGTDEVVASHRPGPSDGRFRISAHAPVGLLPRVSEMSAEIDTGCGSGSGRLTAFVWPPKECLQVDESGEPVDSI